MAAVKSVPPIVSVLIPCYGRADYLKNTIGKTRTQSFESVEIVVVDDCSPGRDVRDCALEYPDVQYIRLEENVGLIAARNVGTNHCRGRYLVNLDDDSWLVSTDAIKEAVAFMDSTPDVGVLAFNVGLKASGYQWPPERAPFDTSHYTGCGNMYRSAVIQHVGPYVEALRRQGEEVERSMRIWDAGYRVVAQPGILVFHDESPTNRNIPANHARDALNYLRRELMRAPLICLPFAVVRAALFAARHWRELDQSLFWAELRGARGPSIVEFVGKRFRKAVSLKTYLRFQRLVSLERRISNSGKRG